MTQARTRANEVGSPSPRQLSLAAMLRVIVELVFGAVSTLWMRPRSPSRDWHTGETATALPEATSGIQLQETELTAQQGSPIALMVSSTRSVRPSNHEGVLTTASTTPAHHRDCPFLVPLFPAKAGTQSHNGNAGNSRYTRMPPWIPAFAGMSGETSRKSAPA